MLKARRISIAMTMAISMREKELSGLTEQMIFLSDIDLGIEIDLDILPQSISNYFNQSPLLGGDKFKSLPSRIPGILILHFSPNTQTDNEHGNRSNYPVFSPDIAFHRPGPRSRLGHPRCIRPLVGRFLGRRHGYPGLIVYAAES
jgi:hypothetical protein